MGFPRFGNDCVPLHLLAPIARKPGFRLARDRNAGSGSVLCLVSLDDGENPSKGFDSILHGGQAQLGASVFDLEANHPHPVDRDRDRVAAMAFANRTDTVFGRDGRGDGIGMAGHVAICGPLASGRFENCKARLAFVSDELLFGALWFGHFGSTRDAPNRFALCDTLHGLYVQARRIYLDWIR